MLHSDTAALQPNERLIVALDFDTQEDAIEIVDKLGGLVTFYKVGWQLFLREGWPLVGELLRKGERVFLDLKIHDIGETVRAAIANMPSEYGSSLELLTIHGNRSTVEAAKNGRSGGSKPKLLMLTALSSWDEWDLKDSLATGSDVDINAYVDRKAKAALDAGCDGLIASGDSVGYLREKYKDRNFLIVVPGIRPEGTAKDDHKRSLTPYEAIVSGADYLVVGRPITRSRDPLDSATKIIDDIRRAAIESATIGLKV